MIQLEPIIQLGIGGLSVYLMYRIPSNHIEHNTRAILRLADAIGDLKDWLKKNGRK